MSFQEDSGVFSTPSKSFPPRSSTPNFASPRESSQRLQSMTQSPIRRYRLHHLIEDDTKTDETNVLKSKIDDSAGELGQVSDALPLLPLANGLTSGFNHDPIRNDANQQQDQHAQNKEPIYYKPPSASSRYGFKNVSGNAFSKGSTKSFMKNPIIIKDQHVASSQQAARTFIDDDDVSDNESVPADFPTGQWVNPAVQVALSRQVNKQAQFYKLAINLGLLLVMMLGKGLVNYVMVLVELNQDPNIRTINRFLNSEAELDPAAKSYDLSYYCYVLIKLIETLFIINVAVASYKLLKPQDQCLDLPLTEKQRRLIGLKSIGEEQDEDEDEDETKNRTTRKSRDKLDADVDIDANADLMLKQRHFESQANGNIVAHLPKYTRTNAYSAYTIRTKPTNDTASRQTESTAGQKGDPQIGLSGADFNYGQARRRLAQQQHAPQSDVRGKPMDALDSTEQHNYAKQIQKFSQKYNMDFKFDDDETSIGGRVDTRNILSSLN